ncbi:hypothetical protein QTI24_30955 [Variovorax sp. J22P240]|uniref:hypothetical protein n=1 Tax=Variovorax sp. J22P240 TaxID=3053514 RepID=UPI002575C38E|nr:hypothetical protein [Variovorax sp. J22P240]MDM0003038.1 hypothetical protein [Variovorax sp. J22P240]
MTIVTSTMLAACLAFGSVSVFAQTAAPPTSGSTGPTAPNPQDPSVSSKDAKPMGDHPAVGKDEKQKGTAAMAPDPTGKDSMAKDNKPKHPAADGKKTPDPK